MFGDAMDNDEDGETSPERKGRTWRMMASSLLQISVCLCISTFNPYDIS